MSTATTVILRNEVVAS